MDVHYRLYADDLKFFCEVEDENDAVKLQSAVDNFKDLGVYFDSDLKFRTHISDVA